MPLSTSAGFPETLNGKPGGAANDALILPRLPQGAQGDHGWGRNFGGVSACSVLGALSKPNAGLADSMVAVDVHVVPAQRVPPLAMRLLTFTNTY